MIIAKTNVISAEPQWTLPPPPVSRFRHTDRKRDNLTLEWEIPEVEFQRYPKTHNWIIDSREHVTPKWKRLATLPPRTTR